MVKNNKESRVYKVKKIEMNEFKEELQKLEVLDKEWQDKLLMVARLYKSMGYGLKNIDNEEEELEKINRHITEILGKISSPNLVDFYQFKTLENLTSIFKMYKNSIMPQMIEKVFFYQNIDNNCSRNVSENIENVFSDVSLSVIERLYSNKELRKKISEFLIKRYGKEILGRLYSEKLEPLKEDFYYFYKEVPEYKDVIEKVFIEEIARYEKEKSKKIRVGLMERIKNINQFFYDCGYLEKVKNMHNNAMKKMGLDFLGVTMQEDKEKFNVCNLMSEKYLGQFDTSELFLLSAFYTNRFEKVYESLQDGMYLQLKLKTFYDTVDAGEVPRKIEDADARIVLKQKRFMEMLSRDKMQKIKVDVNEGKIPEDEDFLEIPKEQEKKYADVYREYFSRYIHEDENDFAVDYSFIFWNRMHSYVLYSLKDFSIESFLYILSRNKTKINFGIVKENRKKVNEYGEQQILIGVDYKELSTIMLHFPEESFHEFLEEAFPDKNFPEYLGNEDFYFRGNPIKTYVAYKYTKAEKQKIKILYDTMDKKSELYPYIRHLYWNIHPAKNPLNNKKKNSEIDI